MSRAKKARTVFFDDSFTYDRTQNYDLDTFKNLTITKVQSIASTLNIRNVKKYKKEQLIPLVLEKHCQAPVNEGEIEQVYIATTALYEKKQVYKIGKAECSVKRLKSLNTGRAPDDDLYLCHVAHCYNAIKMEKMIHAALNEYRLSPNREFFKHSFDKIKSVVDGIVGGNL